MDHTIWSLIPPLLSEASFSSPFSSGRDCSSAHFSGLGGVLLLHNLSIVSKYEMSLSNSFVKIFSAS